MVVSAGWYSAEFGAALDTCGDEALTLYANLGTGLRGEEEVCPIDLPLYRGPEIAVTRSNEFSSLHVEFQSNLLSKYRCAFASLYEGSFEWLASGRLARSKGQTTMQESVPSLGGLTTSLWGMFASLAST